MFVCLDVREIAEGVTIISDYILIWMRGGLEMMDFIRSILCLYEASVEPDSEFQED